MNVRRTLAAGFRLWLSSVALAAASELDIPELAGHPTSRFPLMLHAGGILEPAIDRALRQAVDDWNRLAKNALGVSAFRWTDEASAAAVRVERAASAPKALMGQTDLHVDERGVVELPVRITLYAVEARGETSRDTLLYEVAAHELGHALGLPHTNDPRSVLCCVRGTARFDDAEFRDAYVSARRNPDLSSVRGQLVEHYERFRRASADGRAPRATGR